MFLIVFMYGVTVVYSLTKKGRMYKGNRRMKGKRMLILSEAFGAGHTKAAQAIKEGIQQLDGDWEAEVLELGVWLRPKFSHLISGIYLKTLRYSPKLWGMVYRRVQNKSVKPRFEFILHRFIYAEILQLLQEYQPDEIIATHPFPSAVISRLKRMGLDVTLHTVLTDYGAHGSWVSSGVDYYYLPSKEAKYQLIKLGVPEERIFVTGIPTHPKFWSKNDKLAIRNKLGLKDLPTLLYMGGGMGIGFSPDMLQTLFQFHDEAQLLIVTGRNYQLYKTLKESEDDQHENVHLYGFVDNIDELMDAADLIITKPGGVTSAEALAKGIPMMILNPIPGQEEDNSLFIQQNQLGISVSQIDELKLFLEQFVEDPSLALTNFNPNNYHFTGRKTIEEILKNVV